MSIDGNSDAWYTLVYRGGLWHINNKVYAVFIIMEEHLSTASSKPVYPLSMNVICVLVIMMQFLLKIRNFTDLSDERTCDYV